MENKYFWNSIKDIPVLPMVPDSYEKDEVLLFRTPLNLINHLMWTQLSDYEFYSNVNATDETIITIHSYYSEMIYELYKAKEIKIPANETLKDIILIDNKSRLDESPKKHARIRNCFTENSDEIKKYIKGLYGLKDLDRYCSKSEEKIVIPIDEKAVPYDRTLVVWICDAVLAIYREDLEGNLSLVGCSDYYIDYLVEVYPNSNKYWAKRLKTELEASRESGGFQSIYIPGMNPMRLKESYNEERNNGNDNDH